MQTATGTATQQIEIAGRSYSATRMIHDNGRVYWNLVGVRGASYFTCPYVNNPDVSFLVGGFKVNPLGFRVDFAETDGKLTVL